jgi:PAS domain S-box-containing protein
MAFFTKLTQMLSQLSYSNIRLARLLSERDRLADSLRKSEQRLHRAQEIAHLGSWELDLTGEELTWSDEVYRIFGLKPQEFGAAYEAFLDRVHPDDRDAVNAAYTGSLRENRDTYEIEHRVVRKSNGQIRFVHEKCEHFRDAAGRIIRSVGMVHDITERKQAEEELQKANVQLHEHARKLQETNKELESFAYTISHDLRAPLRAINGFARMLAGDYGPSLEEEGKRRLGVIETNAVKMGLLIDDLLAFSRAGRTALNVSRIDMNGLVFEVLEGLKTAQGGAPKAEIRVAALPPARGDHTLIRQVLSNLLENAMKFSRKRPQPKIEVGSFQRDGEHVYFVKDNGVGFDMKYYGKIFGVFQRLVSEKEFEGTGVGLAIVQRLVTRHGGRVWAEAKPGEGATFFFTLKQGGVAGESGSCILT